MKGYTFGPNLYVLTLGGCDVILGVQWLSVLGIQWDFYSTYVLGLYNFMNWPKGSIYIYIYISYKDLLYI